MMDMPRADVFWSRVDKSGECWIWRGALMSKKGGYGCFGANKRQYYAHRYAYEAQHGPIPEGMCVCHRCDTPLCVRGDHLFLGSNLDNIRDRTSKRREVRGEQSNLSKLSEKLVRDIRALQASVIMADVARFYGISESTVRAIWDRTTWRHVA